MLRPFIQQTPAPSFDRPFLNEIKESFQQLWHSPEALPYLLATLLAIFFVVLLGLLYNRFARHRYKNVLPPGWYVDADKIQEILEVALEQRSKFELRFLPTDYTRRAAACALLDIGAETLTLEPPTYVEAGQNWVDREIECFFRINEERGQVFFYRFTSTIQAVSYAPQDIARVEVEFPKLLHNHQKRGFLRISPPAHLFMGVAIWLERSLPQNERGAPAADLSRWSKPLFTYIPDKKSNPVQVKNISAGGLRLGIERSAVKGRDIEMRLSDRIVILLDLYDPDTERKKRFWLRCRVQNFQEDFDTKDLEIGLQFVGVGRLEENGEKRVIWFDVGEDGIEPMAVWVMQRHLELFREKGLD
jgi:hypothetical protein